MQRTLYEMDIENDRKRAVEEGKCQGLHQGLEEGKQQGIEQGVQQGHQQGLNDERLALVKDLINSGQSKEQALQFLTQIRKLPENKAEKYYHQAKNND
ncbi:hypothetical protein [Limosilactobacillus avistercoris]|uniref:hypothetical protein n=1 Tax=Limosilactobacillus avistercoris TaxID=2762243 RepID=UPI001CD8DF0B|nr:hypothetical protein [Limosilactobacillus avistercoris]